MRKKQRKYKVGDHVCWAGEKWRIKKIWQTSTEGLRADLESLAARLLDRGVFDPKARPIFVLVRHVAAKQSIEPLKTGGHDLIEQV